MKYNETFDEEPFIIAEKIKIFRTILVISTLILFMMGLFRFYNNEMTQAIADGVIALLILLSVPKLHNNIKHYYLFARAYLIVMALLILYANLRLVPTHFHNLYHLGFIVVIFVLLKRKEAMIWAAITFTILFIGYVVHLSISIPEVIAFLLVATLFMFIINYYLRLIDMNNEYQIELAQEKRNALLSKMVSMVAHHWRQPLAALGALSIEMRLKIALNEKDNEEHFEQNLEKIDSYIKQLSETIGVFQHIFTPTQSKSREELDTLLKEVMDEHEERLKDLNIAVRASYEERPIVVNKNEMKRAISAVVDNAIDALEGIDNPTLDIKFEERDHKSIVTICDNGKGVEDIESIFDPYYSTKTIQNNVGLGLYIARLFCEKNGVALEVNQQQNGACFSFVFKHE